MKISLFVTSYVAYFLNQGVGCEYSVGFFIFPNPPGMGVGVDQVRLKFSRRPGTISAPPIMDILFEFLVHPLQREHENER